MSPIGNARAQAHARRRAPLLALAAAGVLAASACAATPVGTLNTSAAYSTEGDDIPVSIGPEGDEAHSLARVLQTRALLLVIDNFEHLLPAAVLVAARASNWRIAHNRIRNTRPTNRKNQDDLISVTALGGGGVIERNLLIRSSYGRAVGIGPRRRGAWAPRGITVRYNTMFANRGPANIEMRFGSHRNRIYRNLMVRSRPRHPNIAAYKLWGKGNLVYQNLGWRSRTVVNRRAFAAK
jgi:hypothetical protein